MRAIKIHASYIAGHRRLWQSVVTGGSVDFPRAVPPTHSLVTAPLGSVARVGRWHHRGDEQQASAATDGTDVTLGFGQLGLVAAVESLRGMRDIVPGRLVRARQTPLRTRSTRPTASVTLARNQADEARACLFVSW